jgi:hypothetical protein
MSACRIRAWSVPLHLSFHNWYVHFRNHPRKRPFADKIANSHFSSLSGESWRSELCKIFSRSSRSCSLTALCVAPVSLPAFRHLRAKTRPIGRLLGCRLLLQAVALQGHLKACTIRSPRPSLARGRAPDAKPSLATRRHYCSLAWVSRSAILSANGCASCPTDSA